VPDPAGAGAIRPLRKEDRPPLLRLIEATGVFSEDELTIALELIDAVLERPGLQDYLVNVYDDGEVSGYYCVGPTPGTLGTFDLYWIAVSPERHGHGIGSALLRHAEDLLRAQGGRLVIVETSSRPQYEPTRRFYVTMRYAELARIPAYYRPGDDLVIYGKYLS
jgi:ribosomal protein S18 acetylase RimI-like enzyme